MRVVVVVTEVVVAVVVDLVWLWGMWIGCGGSVVFLGCGSLVVVVCFGCSDNSCITQHQPHRPHQSTTPTTPHRPTEAEAGDVLVLTKPLGVQAAITADQYLNDPEQFDKLQKIVEVVW